MRHARNMTCAASQCAVLLPCYSCVGQPATHACVRGSMKSGCVPVAQALILTANFGASCSTSEGWNVWCMVAVADLLPISRDARRCDDSVLASKALDAGGAI